MGLRSRSDSQQKRGSRHLSINRHRYFSFPTSRMGGPSSNGSEDANPRTMRWTSNENNCDFTPTLFCGEEHLASSSDAIHAAVPDSLEIFVGIPCKGLKHSREIRVGVGRATIRDKPAKKSWGSVTRAVCRRTRIGLMRYINLSITVPLFPY